MIGAQNIIFIPGGAYNFISSIFSGKKLPGDIFIISLGLYQKEYSIIIKKIIIKYISIKIIIKIIFNFYFKRFIILFLVKIFIEYFLFKFNIIYSR